MNHLGGRLPTLEEHNEQTRLTREMMRRPGAGVLCSTCGTEMVETYPGQINTSSPPSTSVHCPKCGRPGLKY